jgi:hypothetical protein
MDTLTETMIPANEDNWRDPLPLVRLPVMQNCRKDTLLLLNHFFEMLNAAGFTLEGSVNTESDSFDVSNGIPRSLDNL